MFKIQENKIYAFIDSQNLNLGVRSQRWVLDFGRFIKYLEDKYRAEKTFLLLVISQATNLCILICKNLDILLFLNQP